MGNGTNGRVTETGTGDSAVGRTMQSTPVEWKLSAGGTAGRVTFPNNCTRCGFCCITVVCPIAIELGVSPYDLPCPLLDYDKNGEATCVFFIAQLLIGYG